MTPRTPRRIAPPCPAAQLGEIAVAQARLLNQSLRRYRRATEHCRTCPLAPNCAIRDRINATIDTAIREIAEEWNL